MGPKSKQEIKLFFDGQEIGHIIPTITVSDDCGIKDNNPFDLNEISVTLRLNWWNRLKVKYYLWKIFRDIKSNT